VSAASRLEFIPAMIPTLVLELETDSGTTELAMNRIVAERLHSAVVDFLQAGEGDDAPTFSVERTQ
jgi:hypothetical protein